MYVPVLNYFLDVEEAIVILCVVIIAYIAVMHIEYKQLKIIAKKFNSGDSEFSKSLRELKTDLSTLNDLLRAKEIRTISSHVSGTKKAEAPAEEKAPSTETKSDAVSEKSSDSAPSGDSKDLKSMLDKV